MSVFTLPCKGAEYASHLFSGSFCPHLSMFGFLDALWLWKQTEEEKRPHVLQSRNAEAQGKLEGDLKSPLQSQTAVLQDSYGLFICTYLL